MLIMMGITNRNNADNNRNNSTHNNREKKD